jgi:hypothetical protein
MFSPFLVCFAETNLASLTLQSNCIGSVIS